MDNESKKQVPLRLSPKLYAQVAAWAEDDFRSINGQIEYLLSQCVKQRKKDGKYVSESLDEDLELVIPDTSDESRKSSKSSSDDS